VTQHRDEVEVVRGPVAAADAHADSLMWNRDLTVASTRGHVDFPRLAEAGVTLQCFTIVTRGLPIVDGFSLFARRQGWPPHARRSEWPRCTWQIDRLADFCRCSNGRASIAGTGAQLEKNLAEGRLSAVLGVEGGHALEGQPDRVATLVERGVRFMSLTHLSNNELGGTSTPLHGNRPLTPLGRQVLDAMAEAGMILDLAHASPSMLPILLDFPGRLFCSHAGIFGANAMWRNLTDEVLAKIAARGGVVGVIFAPQFLGGKSLGQLALHVRHALDVMGEDGVAFGSDFDGMIPLPQGMRDVRDLPMVTHALLEAGLPARVVEKVAGANLRRFFLETLGALKR
jgi:membrane dipeptidase